MHNKAFLARVSLETGTHQPLIFIRKKIFCISARSDTSKLKRLLQWIALMLLLKVLLQFQVLHMISKMV